MPLRSQDATACSVSPSQRARPASVISSSAVGATASALAVVSALALPFVDATARAQAPDGPAFPPSLKGVWVPRPTQLSQFVRDEVMLTVLGKSLFWDVAVGSDMQTACASCHGHAGIDPRRLNVVHPGANGTFDSRTGPGEKKGADFFPTTVFADPSSRFSPILRDLDDIAGSQGVLRQILIDVDTGAQVELCDPLPEPVFEGNGLAWRQVTGRNPPTTINAVFNIRNFWDGRANPWFNGMNGLGPVDPAARVWRWDGGTSEPTQVPVMLDYSSLASQAVGPVLNAVEMSCSGRNWPQLAGRLLDRRPLAAQRVRVDDSVLGAYVDPSGIGLSMTYRELIDAAFAPQWRSTRPTAGGEPQVEANFPLIFGLAVQSYESTLVSDDARYDRFAEAGFPEDGGGHLDEQELRGLRIFANSGEVQDLPAGRCLACHSGPLFSSATWPEAGTLPGGASPRRAPNGIERMLAMAGARLATAVFADSPGVGDPSISRLTFDLDGAEVVLVELGDDGRGGDSRDDDDDDDDDDDNDDDDDDNDDGDADDSDDADIVLAWSLPQVSQLPCPSHRNYTVPLKDDEGVLHVEIRRNLDAGSQCRTWIMFRLEDADLGSYRLRIGGHDRADLMMMRSGAYDRGFYNIGVRPTAEDLGVGGTQAGEVPLSWTRRRQGGWPLPEVANPSHVPANAHAAVNGAFKTPTLRNVELTGPYFHNGGQATLRQVMEFYNRGGDFHEANIEDLSPDMNALGLSDADLDAVVAFMLTLTDERVRHEQAPFDHPELPLPNGITMPAVGAGGRDAGCLPPLQSFEVRLEEQSDDVPVDPPGVDCDGNGVPDACDMSDGADDSNGNRRLDSCERDYGDFDLDGMVGGIDLAMLMTMWGEIAPRYGDLSGDGRVGGIDLAILMTRWGTAP